MASCSDLSNDIKNSHSNVLISNPTTSPAHTAQSVPSRYIEHCDSGYSSDVSTASTSKPRIHHRPIREAKSPTPLRREKQRLIKTTTSPYPSQTCTLSTSSQSSAPPRTHRNHSRHSSRAPTPRHHSTPSSRRSSFLLRAPTGTSPLYLSTHKHRASSANNFLLHDNPFLHRPAEPPQSRPSSRTPSSSPSLTNQSTPLPSPDFQLEKEPRYSNFLPAPTINWTLPSTQQQIRKPNSNRGIHGLWRKVFSKEREGYVEGDGGCVRRYIQPKWKKAKEGDNESGDFRFGREKEGLCGWRCFGVQSGGS